MCVATEMEPAVVVLPARRKASGASGWWLRAGIGVTILGWLIFNTKWSAIGAVLVGVHLDLCLASLALYCAAQVVSSYRWQVLARALGFDESLGRYTALYFVGMFFSLFLPTSVGGDVARVWYLTTRPGERWLAALSVFSERFSGLLALLLIACVATLGNLALLDAWTLWMVWGATAAACLGLLALPILGRWNERCRSLAKGLSFYRGHLGRWTGAMGLSLLVQGASVVQIWLLGQALDLPVPFVAYAVAVPVVSLLTMLPISINGMGVREGSLVLLLAPVGITNPGAVALGMLWFCVTAVASLMGGGVYVLGRFSRQEWKDVYGPVRGDSDQGRAGQPAAAA